MTIWDRVLFWIFPDPDNPYECPMCHGSKKAGGSTWAFSTPCPYCYGTGKAHTKREDD